MLTDVELRSAKPDRKKAYKLADSRGLYVLVMPSGSKYFRWKYRYAGREKALALGVYGDVSLADARIARDEARLKLTRDGIDPGAERQAEKRKRVLSVETAFEPIAREWHASQLNSWSAHHAADVLHRLEVDIFPDLGDKPIAEIEAPDVLAALRKIEARGAHELARRALQNVRRVFRYAIATQWTKRNVAADLEDALAAKPDVKHVAALGEKELPEFLRKLAADETMTPQTKAALRLVLLTVVRTGELRGATWGEFDLQRAEWRIPPERMKAGEEHVVPLSRQALAVLRELEPGAADELLFVNANNATKPISENTMLYACYRLGYHGRVTPHGFRSSFSTILNDRGHDPDAVEAALAHAVPGVRGTYNRGKKLEARRELMQVWADMVTAWQSGATVLPMRRTA